jgi:very-short-patch-repair endonuclease
LIERLRDPRYEEVTFGVLSLFREQIEHIQALVEREVDRDLLEQHRVICSTVDGFQGDERDVILYSWRFAKGASPSIFAFTNGEGGSQRVNVALTRARHQAIHFVSASIDEFPLGAGNVTPYLKHGLDPERLLSAIERHAHRTPGGEARRRVARALVDAGFDVEEDFIACGASIDLLVTSEAGARIAVFVDAEVDPHPAVAALHRVDVHSLLERAGWNVVRIPATEALPNPQRIVGLVSSALDGVSAVATIEVVDAPYATVSVDRQKIEEWIEGLEDLGAEIEPEDRADYHWEVGSVEARLHAGDTVFMSDFERELYDRIAAVDGVVCVPQWPSRGKFIDLVVTDRDGRRLAIEADGEQHHEMNGGALIPEDIERQRLLEEAGWVFHRIRHSEFKGNPEGEIDRLFAHLREQPANADLAARMRGEDLPDLLAVPLLQSPAEPSDDAGHVSSATTLVADPLPVDDADVDGESAAELPTREGEEAVLNDETEHLPRPFDASMTPPQIEGLLDEVFAGLDEVEERDRHDAQLDDDAAETASAAAAPDAGVGPVEQIGELGDIPLRVMATCVSALVSFRGSLKDEDLIEAFADYYKLDVPPSLRSLVMKFAWSAKGHQFVEFDGETWTPGNAEPHEIVNFGKWTFKTVVERAKRLLPTKPEKEVYHQLLHEVYATPSGRVPRIVTTTVGKAIWQAQHQP